ncbi:MAG: glycerol kinase GlpK [Promicromonosporaceae bacterium]|nr:glycerol kinase GlpK [Promicromonosporaceae bacterium]
MADYILSIDQGTTSTRSIVFDRSGKIVSVGQLEHAQIYPQPGWVEHDPKEIWRNAREVVGLALTRADITYASVAAVGITNQRETAVVWDKTNGEPVYNAIVWQDTRTSDICDELADGSPLGRDRYRQITGLPLATYFSGPKVKWILDNVPGAREKAERGDLLFGNTDAWLLWHMTGGSNGGVHATDVTNASRTLLMDLETLTWREDICADLGIPLSMLPKIRSSSEVYGTARSQGLIPGVPIAGILGDQQAASVGEVCFEVGDAKNTYGTGSFLLMNTGTKPVRSEQLLTTVLYKFGDQPQVYALEGSIANVGSVVQWLRDNLGFFAAAPEIEGMARAVDNNGGCYFVPAFSGLFAPYWRTDARGAIVGLTAFVTKDHIARAALEAAAYQTRAVMEAMKRDSGVTLRELKADGGMSGNSFVMQFQADQLGVDVVRPMVRETTALGAAYAAGLAVGFWADEAELKANWKENHRWHPEMPDDERQRLYRKWNKAVTRTFDWVDDDTAIPDEPDLVVDLPTPTREVPIVL